jgi:hypothetical protein
MALPKFTLRATWAALRGWAAAARKRLLARLAKVPRWGWIVLATIAALLLVRWGYEFPWTGFAETYVPKSNETEYRPAKTVWDWLGLLIIPVLLAIGGYVFTHRRETLARELEADRLREEALQSYIDRMAKLVLDKSLGQSKEDDPVRDVARSQTLLALRRLDAERKGLLLGFLHESDLITKGKTIIRLVGADLSGADLGGNVGFDLS